MFEAFFIKFRSQQKRVKFNVNTNTKAINMCLRTRPLVVELLAQRRNDVYIAFEATGPSLLIRSVKRTAHRSG